MACIIRNIDENELHIVTSLSHQIWPVAYREIITTAQIEYMLKTMYSEEALQNNLKDGHVFLIAEIDKTPIAYAGFQPHFPMLNTAKLHKLYVLPNLQGKNIGRQLFHEVQEQSRKAHCNHLILQVNRNNPAQFFYQKLGMYIQEEQVIDIGNGFVMDDYIMRLDW